MTVQSPIRSASSASTRPWTTPRRLKMYLYAIYGAALLVFLAALFGNAPAGERNADNR
jgi:hypothetical protein